MKSVHAALTLLLLLAHPLTSRADTTPQALPFSQDWSNAGLITTDDNWDVVPGIVGYLGDDPSNTTIPLRDPSTILTDFTTVDVIAQATPATGRGGVGEMDGLSNPCVALQGSGTADNPFLLFHLDTTGKQNIVFVCNLRDVDDTTDNSIQPISIQYRAGNTGAFTHLHLTPNATTGPSAATLVTPVSVLLPPAANNQPLVQVRIMTGNALGVDEWVGIDDILVKETILVTNATDSVPAVPGSLRQAIADALPGDTITFAPGLTGPIVLASEIVIDKNLTIDASSLSGGKTIDGGAGFNRIFSVATTGDLTLRSLALTGGNGAGAVRGGFGGGIFNSGTVTLNNSTLSGNTAAYDGGGIFNADQLTLNNSNQLTLNNSIVADNSSSPVGLGQDIFKSDGLISAIGVNLIGNLGGSGLSAGPSVIVASPSSPRSATTAAPRRPCHRCPAARPSMPPSAAPPPPTSVASPSSARPTSVRWSALPPIFPSLALPTSATPNWDRTKTYHSH